jgi:hypothetical protein
MEIVNRPSSRPALPPLRWAGFLLGFRLGGTLDRIVLHQVLQWHHLLSNVQAAALQDRRAQHDALKALRGDFDDLPAKDAGAASRVRAALAA